MPVDYRDAYDRYRVNPTPDRLYDVVKSMDATINHALISVGSQDDPLMRSQAQAYAAEAIKTFNPDSGAQLPTWVSQNLMQLRRFKRQNSGPLKMPERIHLDAMALTRAEAEFLDSKDRDPTLEELADMTGLSMRRIKKVREAFRKTPTEGLETAGEGNFASSVAALEPDYTGEALDYVYADADPIDKQLIELTTGYGGKEPISAADAAKRLKLSPVQVTRRRAKLALKLQEIERGLQRI
jgi:DNA-directed RNA polymerase specialized sigma subunit